MKKVNSKDYSFKMTDGTSLSGLVTANYNQLVELFGEPTLSEPSGDNKVQKEWVVEYKDKFYTIYDWKTYDLEFTMNETFKWHVGSLGNAGEFITKLNKKLTGIS
jgi:hypothetical protein